MQWKFKNKFRKGTRATEYVMGPRQYGVTNLAGYPVSNILFISAKAKYFIVCNTAFSYFPLCSNFIRIKVQENIDCFYL